VKPILKALLLADHVYEDRTTGKKIIAGTINTVVIAEAELRAYAYISLTDVHGTARLRLELTDLSDDEDEPLLEFEVTVTGADPLDIIELVVPFAPLPTPHDGYYTLELSSKEGTALELLGSHRFEAIIAEGEDQ
jgi:hypothetical protein